VSRFRDPVFQEDEPWAFTINVATDTPGHNGTTVPLRLFPTKTREREEIAVWLEHDQLKASHALLERDGVPIADQI
jgi:hypothetical protein